ncbi:MAG: hypothetical protein MUC34_01700 [Anaerolineae bacterium]|jgi:hypothetical protein|nr:hypothetical protein [Anaerolineae bacterium]
MGDDIVSRIEYDPAAPDVESIMRQVRAHLGESAGRPQRVARTGQVEPDPRFVDRLREAEASVAAMVTGPQLTPAGVPVIGGLLDRVRLEFHRLVVYYLSRFAQAQGRFNRETVTAVEALATAEARVAALEAQVASLEARLAALEAAGEAPAAAPTRRG